MQPFSTAQSAPGRTAYAGICYMLQCTAHMVASPHSIAERSWSHCRSFYTPAAVLCCAMRCRAVLRVPPPCSSHIGSETTAGYVERSTSACGLHTSTRPMPCCAVLCYVMLCCAACRALLCLCSGSETTAKYVERSSRWHHLAVTWSTEHDGLTRIYWDGLLMAEAVSKQIKPLEPGGAFMLGAEQVRYATCY